MLEIKKIIKPAKKDKNNFKVIANRFFAKKEKPFKILNPYEL